MAPTTDMAVESWLHGLSYDIIRSTTRLQQCYHDDPWRPIVADPFKLRLRMYTKHKCTIFEEFEATMVASYTSRPATALIIGTPRRVCISFTTIDTCRAVQSSSTHVYQTQMRHVWGTGPSWRHNTWYVHRELTSRPAIAHHQDTSSSVASTP